MSERMDKGEKTVIAISVGVVVLWAAFWLGLVAVAIHFIRKWW